MEEGSMVLGQPAGLCWALSEGTGSRGMVVRPCLSEVTVAAWARESRRPSEGL